MGCIYKITNLTNNKIYIGQTKYTSDWRWKTHLRDAFDEKCGNYNVLLHKAIRKYGIDSFVVEDIEYCTTKNLSTRETYWIKHYDSFNKEKGYNMTLGGEGSKLYNDEDVMELWNKGYCASDIVKLLPYKIGNTTVRNILYGNGVKQEEILKRKGKAISKINGKMVYQYDIKTGKFLKTFASVRHAGKELHISSVSNIAQCANGQIKSANGYLWSYEKKDKIDLPKHFNKIMIVGKYTLDGQLVALYTSLNSAQRNNRDIGANRKTIAIYCEKQKPYKGFIWKYINTDGGIIHVFE